MLRLPSASQAAALCRELFAILDLEIRGWATQLNRKPSDRAPRRTTSGGLAEGDTRLNLLTIQFDCPTPHAAEQTLQLISCVQVQSPTDLNDVIACRHKHPLKTRGRAS